MGSNISMKDIVKVAWILLHRIHHLVGQVSVQVPAPPTHTVLGRILYSPQPCLAILAYISSESCVICSAVCCDILGTHYALYITHVSLVYYALLCDVIHLVLTMLWCCRSYNPKVGTTPCQHSSQATFTKSGACLNGNIISCGGSGKYACM